MKSEKRETAYINQGIVGRTEDVFPDETKLIRASTNLMRRMTKVSKAAISQISSNADLSAIMNLFARNRELVHFSMVCLLNGGYAPTKVLVRTALENTLCLRLFNKKPELAEKWFTSPDQIREKWTPRRSEMSYSLRAQVCGTHTTSSIGSYVTIPIHLSRAGVN